MNEQAEDNKCLVVIIKGALAELGYSVSLLDAEAAMVSAVYKFGWHHKPYDVDLVLTEAIYLLKGEIENESNTNTN